MIFNELKLYFKKYKVITIIIYFQITLILILLGSFLYFMTSLKYEEKGLKEIYEGKALYTLIDNYINEDEENLMNSDNSLNVVKNYYTSLNNSNNFEYLNINFQPIGLIDGKVNDIFKDGYENGQIPEITNNLTPIKSVQLNQKAFNFFKIDVTEGKKFIENDFIFNNKYIPIILGDSYKKIYKIGDIVPIEYYFNKFNAKVIGFAKPSSKVLFNGNIEEYLDRYMILPQIDFDVPADKNEYEFQKIVYLVRSNGYVAVDNDINSIQNMMSEIQLISEKTGFQKYLFIGHNPHLNQYKNLLSVIRENQNLIKGILIVTTLCNILILGVIITLQNKRRYSYYAIHYMQGATVKQLIFQQYIEIISIFLLAYITYFVILNNIFFIGDNKIHLALLLFILVLSLILTIISRYQIITNSISKFLSTNEIGDE